MMPSSQCYPAETHRTVRSSCVDCDNLGAEAQDPDPQCHRELNPGAAWLPSQKVTRESHEVWLYDFLIKKGSKVLPH
jgi:hypothetical protein